MKFSIKDFFSKCEEILNAEILNENFIFCEVFRGQNKHYFRQN